MEFCLKELKDILQLKQEKIFYVFISRMKYFAFWTRYQLCTRKEGHNYSENDLVRRWQQLILSPTFSKHLVEP